MTISKYRAPELNQEKQILTPATDVWLLGIIIIIII